MERVIFIALLVAGMAAFMPFVKHFPRRFQRPVQQAVFAVYLLGNLYVTLLSREAGPAAHLEMELFGAYRESFELDYGLLGTLRRLLTEGFPAGIRLVSTEPLEGAILNILLYVPMGYLLPVVWPRLRFRHGLMAGCAASFLTETIQLFFHLGWFDADDLINNALGTLVGLMLHAIFLKRGQQRRRV